MDELDRADVQAPGRLCGDQRPWVARDFARDHDLLLIAAGECRRARPRPAAANVELLEQPSGPGDHASGPKPAELCERLLFVVVEGEVLGEREVEHQPAQMTVLGDMTQA